MSEYETIIQTIALTMGVAWASGINLYAAIGALGLAGAFGYVDLPPTLEVLQNPGVILAAGLLYCGEFMADKIPGIDSAWDALHTFIRVPAGALLAAGAVGDVTPALVIAAGVVGGGIATATHATKAGARALINTSPEPFSNWAASLGEDLAVFVGLWAALQHPVLFLSVFFLFLLLLCWLLPKLWRGAALVFRKIGRWLGLISDAPGEGQLQDLQRLWQEGLITPDEYHAALSRFHTRVGESSPSTG